jgi:hypothetical protein
MRINSFPQKNHTQRNILHILGYQQLQKHSEHTLHRSQNTNFNMGQSLIFEENVEIVERPLEDDVLCGKNKECLEHPGSKSFREVVDRYVERYQQADSKVRKMRLSLVSI